MTRDEVRAFVDRDWAQIARSDRDYWVQRFRAEGPQATVGASHALFEHGRRMRNDFPGKRYSEADLACQIRLKGLLDRASHALTVQPCP